MTLRTLYLLLFAAILTLGCQRDASSDAITLARSRLDQNDYTAAYDMLLAAMRLDPSSPDVFALSLTFVQRANSADSDEAQELAHDLFVRVDGLIPFQPLDHILEARKKYNDVSRLFEKAKASLPTPSDPFAAIQKKVDSIKDQRVPAEVRSQLLQRVRADLEALAGEVAS